MLRSFLVLYIGNASQLSPEGDGILRRMIILLEYFLIQVAIPYFRCQQQTGLSSQLRSVVFRWYISKKS